MRSKDANCYNQYKVCSQYRRPAKKTSINSILQDIKTTQNLLGRVSIKLLITNKDPCKAIFLF